MMIPEGTYRARGLSATPHTNKNGKDAVEVRFEVLDGEHKGLEVRDVWYLATEKSARYTLEKLRTAGCDMPDGDVTRLGDFGSLDCDIVIEHETLQSGRVVARISYCNDPGRGPGSSIERLTDAEAKAFAARWRNVVKQLPPRRRVKAGEDVPF